MQTTITDKIQAAFTNTYESIVEGVTEFAKDAPSHPNALARGLSVGTVLGLSAASVLTPVGGLILGAAVAKWAYDLNRDGEELNNLRENVKFDSKFAQKEYDEEQKQRVESQFKTTFWHAAPALYTMANHMVSADNPEGLALPDMFIPEITVAYYAAKALYQPLDEHTNTTEIRKAQDNIHEQTAKKQALKNPLLSPAQ